jgi:hypothetical protein
MSLSFITQISYNANTETVPWHMLYIKAYCIIAFLQNCSHQSNRQSQRYAINFQFNQCLGCKCSYKWSHNMVYVCVTEGITEPYSDTVNMEKVMTSKLGTVWRIWFLGCNAV